MATIVQIPGSQVFAVDVNNDGKFEPCSPTASQGADYYTIGQGGAVVCETDSRVQSALQRLHISKLYGNMKDIKDTLPIIEDIVINKPVERILKLRSLLSDKCYSYGKCTKAERSKITTLKYAIPALIWLMENAPSLSTEIGGALVRKIGGDEAATESLKLFKRTQVKVLKESCLDIYVSIKGESAWTEVLNASKSSNKIDRKLAANYLCNMYCYPQLKKSALNALYTLMGDKEPEVQAEAINSLGNLGVKESRAKLVAASKNSSPIVSEAASTALEKLDGSLMKMFRCR